MGGLVRTTGSLWEPKRASAAATITMLRSMVKQKEEDEEEGNQASHLESSESRVKTGAPLPSALGLALGASEQERREAASWDMAQPWRLECTAGAAAAGRK